MISDDRPVEQVRAVLVQLAHDVALGHDADQSRRADHHHRADVARDEAGEQLTDDMSGVIVDTAAPLFFNTSAIRTWRLLCKCDGFTPG